jgi:hypothetical protein
LSTLTDKTPLAAAAFCCCRHPPPALPAGKAGVSFTGDTSVGYRANLWLRSAIRVLRLLHETLLDAERPSGEEVRRRQGRQGQGTRSGATGVSPEQQGWPSLQPNASCSKHVDSSHPSSPISCWRPCPCHPPALPSADL